MAQWSNSESGILRKNKKKDNFEDLLVFGYACKVFRDDEKALHIDQGKHLIPWMGDEKIKIDRYDCRGHLSDLSRYESSREGFDARRWMGLDDNERKLEQLCDEERYYSLHINEEEEEMYKEEEQKRNKTNEFQYSYDVPMNPAAQEGVPTVPENEEDEKYVPPPDLDVPVDISIPKTMKESARIEKTAMFVSTQGPQMEILIKAKQCDNPQFSFLNQNDPLYKFYRHVLNAIKTGRYQIKSAKTDQNVQNVSGSDSGDHYLHPSLVSSSVSTMELPVPTIPNVPYRPSVNCAYSQLVNRIQGATGVTGHASPQGQTLGPTGEQQGVAESGQANMANLTLEQQQQYYQYYMQHQYYEYYKHMTQNSDEKPELSMDPNMQAYFQQIMYAQYFQHAQAQQQQQQPTNPYAQIVSNVNKEIPNPYPLPEKPDISKEPVLYSSNPETAVPQVAPTSGKTAQDTVAESPKKPSLLTLMQSYGSDSDASSDDDDEAIDDYKVPEGETKVVVDKMASYVVKNGEDFENIVRSRADPSQGQRGAEEKRGLEGVKKEEEEGSKEIAKSNSNKVKEKKVIAPVSFSIKKPKEETPKEIKSALPVDEETDEDEGNAEQETPPAAPLITQPPTLVSSNSSKIIYKIDTTSNAPKEKEKEQPEKETKEEPKETVENKDTAVKKEEISNKEESNKGVVEKVEVEVVELKKAAERLRKNGGLDRDDPILEMIDLTGDVLYETNGNAKKDEDIFDLTTDKEKASKDNRALQLERRRKAMAFLKLKSGTLNAGLVPDGATTTIPTIDLSNTKSPRGKRISSDSLEDEEDRRSKRGRSRSKDKSLKDKHKSKRSRESEKTVSRKEREKSRKSRSPRADKNYECYEISEKEEGEMSDDNTDTKYKKSSSHKKKKSHKRKHSKSKHSSKSKKKSKKKEFRTISSSSSDSDRSYHS
ncbi:hypothetical protein HHI36_021016 [Cryptolaemus montrouzieri]|uniref:SURP motif domain-containing protein n=1 Tax=Cryptolaemus montrouzieri TaxID=559131 RepID=A0ABD2MWD8_9CUCU